MRTTSVLMALLAFGCTDPTVFEIANDRDGGVEPPRDSGAPDCWQEVAWFGDSGDSQEVGRAVAIAQDQVFVSDHREGNLSWRVHRATSLADGWSFDRSIVGADIGAPGFVVQALAAKDDEIFVAVRGDNGEGGRVWRLTTDLTLAAPDAVSGGSDSFGIAIAVDEGWLVVGDPKRQVVSIYEISAGGTPAPYVTLESRGGAAYGAAVALRGNRLLVGAPTFCEAGRNPFEDCRSTGRVDEYILMGGEWTWSRSIDPPDPKAGKFGAALALLDDDTAIITAPLTYSCVEECYATQASDVPEPGTAGCSAEQTPCPYVGAAYLATQQGVDALPSDQLVPNNLYNTQWGTSVVASDNWVAIASPTESSCSTRSPLSYGCEGAGAVQLYRRRDGALEPFRYLKARDLLNTSRFGAAVALDGRRLVVGAPSHCGASTPGTPCSNSGAVYFFEACE